MIVVQGHLDCDPAKREDLIEAARAVGKATREEPGNLHYSMSPDIDDAGRIQVAERWADDDALSSHMKSAHMATFRGALGGFGIKGASLTRWDTDEGRPLM
jgi:quinol monooxygenase YgiN